MYFQTYYFSFIQTFFGSVKKSKASKPPSLPTPDDFTPPNGVRKSRSNQQLIQTIPACMFCAMRCALVKSCVHTVEANPYTVEFAHINTSSSVSKGIMV